MSSTSVRLTNESDEQRWNEFVFASPYPSFLQTWGWGRVQEKFGVTIWRLVAEEGSELQAVALVVRRDLPLGRCWLYVPRGPAFAKASAGKAYLWQLLQEKLREIAKEEKAIFVRVDPPSPKASKGKSQLDLLTEQGWRKSDREVQPRHTLLLDLTQSEEELLAGMKPKTRYNVRVAQRKGVTVRFSSAAEDVESFLTLARHVHDRSGFHFHPDEYYRAIMEVLSPAKMVELAIAEHEKQTLAAHLMTYTDSIATYAHGASSNEKRELMAPTYLYWETIRRAKQLGCKTYDFFGVAPPDAPPDHPWAGVTRIKEGFGGRRIEYMGAYDWVLDSAMYTVFTVAKRLKSLVR